MSQSDAVEPFVLSIDNAVLADLKRRLEMTRWPEDTPAPAWHHGPPIKDMQRLCAYWRDTYDWRRCERMLNDLGQFRTHIDGVDIHFIHMRSPEPSAMPIVLTHGWPGSVIEFCKVVRPLADPRAHGGDPKDAFHVIVPSLPGYGFSGNPREGNWSTKRIAKAWVTLVRRLGYKHFVCQGGDWGAGVTTDIATLRPQELVAIHTNMAPAFPSPGETDLSAAEKASMADLEANARDGRGYSEIQRTKPQTIGFALADSPMGQAAWIYDKFRDWSDCSGDPLNAYSMDEILDNIMLYWLPNRGATSARLYAEPWPDDWLPENPAFADGKLPVGVSVFPREIFRPARRWVEKKYKRVIHFNELPRGGHFAAFEQPDSFVQEMRACFRSVR